MGQRMVHRINLTITKENGKETSKLSVAKAAEGLHHVIQDSE